MVPGLIHLRKEEDIVKSISRIMDTDAPKLDMTNKNMTQKRRNGADHFSEEHQKIYENMEGRKKDDLKNVRQHNNAVPKLHDELNKKKSLTKVTTINAKYANRNGYDTSCSACVQLLTLKQLQKMKVQPKCTGRKPKPKRHRSPTPPPKISRSHERHMKERHKRHKEKLFGVNKPAKHRTGFNNKHALNKSVQCVNYADENPTRKNSKSSKDENGPNILEEIDAGPGKGSGECLSFQQLRRAPICCKERSSRHTVPASAYSRQHSTSSYNSFLSLEHEPMDQ